MTFSAELLDWYEHNRRILPWREDPSPYHVWLSEIMLQQTRVEAVRDYYLRFIEKLPDIRSLAEAPEDTYLKLWEGLGYYSRVRNLHRAASVIIEEYNGEMPGTSAELMRLGSPGSVRTLPLRSRPLPLGKQSLPWTEICSGCLPAFQDTKGISAHRRRRRQRLSSIKSICLTSVPRSGRPGRVIRTARADRAVRSDRAIRTGILTRR